jgi:cytidylate kinase
LLAKGESVSLPRLLEGIRERDARDSTRSVSPLVAAKDAVLVDSTSLTIDEVLERVTTIAADRGLLGRVSG